MPDRLSAREVGALADAFPNSVSARHLLVRAGVPASRQPAWHGLSPLDFWREIDREISVGIIPDGRRRILAEASADYPGNPDFRAGSADGAGAASHTLAAENGPGPSISVDIDRSQGIVIGPTAPTTFYFGTSPNSMTDDDDDEDE